MAVRQPSESQVSQVADMSSPCTVTVTTCMEHIGQATLGDRMTHEPLADHDSPSFPLTDLDRRQTLARILRLLHRLHTKTICKRSSPVVHEKS